MKAALMILGQHLRGVKGLQRMTPAGMTKHLSGSAQLQLRTEPLICLKGSP